MANTENNIFEDDPYVPVASNKLSLRSASTLGHHDNCLNFQIYPATGGYVLEYTEYDSKHDRMDRRLHIISDTSDLGTSIAHVITIELLKR